jgi:release factor glutamine methyltransferase
LVAAGLGVDPAVVFGWPERACEEAGEARVAELVRRRAAREPVSRILGAREFWGLPFALSRGTLDPRPDSETLVEVALALVRDRGATLRLVDFGTGSGCLLLALLTELPNATGVGVDRAADAAAAARRNARALGLGGRASFLVGDWAEALLGRFHLVIANPPYIPTAAIAGLEPEVAEHDPHLALDGGADGLAAYRALAAATGRLLAPGGHAVFEIGEGQGEAVTLIFEQAGLVYSGAHADLAGRERCLVFSAKKVVELGRYPD